MIPPIRTVLFATVAVMSLAPHGASATDFPMPGCHGPFYTVIALSEPNSSKAMMTGKFTGSNALDYCERMQPPGKTIGQCVDEISQAINKDQAPTVMANCSTGQLDFWSGPDHVTLNFPGDKTTNRSCASGWPGYAMQFSLVCPKAFRELKVELFTAN